MTYLEHINEIRQQVQTELNPFLQSMNLQKITHFCDNGFDVINNDLSLAIYADSPEGEVLKQRDTDIRVSVVFEFFFNGSADSQSVRNNEKYYSAICEYLMKTRFSENDKVSTSQIMRMDMNDQVNGALFLLESRIQSQMDSWLY